MDRMESSFPTTGTSAFHAASAYRYVQRGPAGKEIIYPWRPWEVKKFRTTCPYCGVGCQLSLHVKETKSSRFPASKTLSPIKAGCASREDTALTSYYSEERLKTPLIRENGHFREASWDEATELVANKFKQIIDESGPDAIGGVSCSRSLNEDSYQMQKLFRAVIGTNNVDNCART